ncbi:MAG: TIGR04219 family outer membrane beta-barrel protein [Epsilonproteobacteria bacterium]|nr:TIGR04219 family outer membrane beta-barrel protein [Campylobacterota bacterium]
MKKRVSILAAAVALSSTLSADFLRVELGAGSWMQTPKGMIEAEVTGVKGTDTSSETQEAKPYAWILIKHFVPVVPNLRVEYAQVLNRGTASGTFADFTAALSKSELSMNQIDFAPYYNLLDNTAWITLDVGADFKMIDVSYKVAGVTMNGFPNQTYDKAESVVIPMAYLRTRVQVPMTGLGVEADVKYVSYNENTVYDARAKVDYTFEITPLIQPGIEVGYRVQKYKTDQLQNIAADIDFAGLYAGAMLRF